MPLTPLPLPEGDALFDPAWINVDQADALFARLFESIPWEVHKLHIFGREVESPRLSCWIGDQGAVYTYSGSRFSPRPWSLELLLLRARLESELGAQFNSVLANRYRDGNDSMGWHADHEPELGQQPVIASVSLGATRRFAFKHRRDTTLKRVLDLPHGSLLVMRGATQTHWRHALPRTAKPCGERINLTFRKIYPA